MKLKARLHFIVLGAGCILLAGFAVMSFFGTDRITTESSGNIRATNGMPQFPERRPVSPGTAEPISCSSVSPFSASLVEPCSRPTELEFASLDAREVRSPRIELEVDRIVEAVMRGSTENGLGYLYLRQYCSDPPDFPDIRVECTKVKDAAEQFRRALETNAHRGDAQAQKMLAIELIGEVHSEVRAASLLLLNTSSPVQVIQMPLFTYSPKWSSALNHLRTAASTDPEAEWLLQRYSSMQ